MRGRNNLLKYLVFGMISVLIMASFPIVLSDTGYQENEKFEGKNTDPASQTFHFSDCIVVVTGNCNFVTGPLVWIFGVYCPLLKRNFNIMTNNGEDESINVFVLGKGLQIGTYLSQSHIFVDINRARGILYWAGKSSSNPGNSITLFCRASNIWITTYD